VSHKKKKVHFASEVTVRTVFRLKEAFGGWFDNYVDRRKVVVRNSIGFALSNEFEDTTADLDRQVDLQETREPLSGWSQSHIKYKTGGKVIPVQWEVSDNQISHI